MSNTRRLHFLLLSALFTPDASWDVTDRLKWNLEGRAKWMAYDERDAGGLSRDYRNLQATTSLSWKPAAVVKIAGSLRGAFDLYDNRAKRRQVFSVGIGIDSRVGAFLVGGDYRGSLRLGLGAESTVSTRLDHTFGLDVTWDPNR